MINSSCAALCRVLTRRIDALTNQMHAVCHVINYVAKDNVSLDSIFDLKGTWKNEPYVEISKIFQYSWAVKKSMRYLMEDHFSARKFYFDKYDEYEMLPDQFIDRKKDVELLVGDAYAAQFHYFLEKAVKPVRNTLYHCVLMWWHQEFLQERHRLVVDDIDVAGMASKINNALGDFLENVDGILEVMIAWVNRGSGDDTSNSAGVKPSSAHPHTDHRHQHDHFGSYVNDHVQRLREVSKMHEYSAENEANELQKLKALLKTLNHESVKSELNDILNRRETEGRMLEMIRKAYEWTEEEHRAWIHEHANDANPKISNQEGISLGTGAFIKDIGTMREDPIRDRYVYLSDKYNDHDLEVEEAIELFVYDFSYSLKKEWTYVYVLIRHGMADPKNRLSLSANMGEYAKARYFTCMKKEHSKDLLHKDLAEFNAIKRAMRDMSTCLMQRLLGVTLNTENERGYEKLREFLAADPRPPKVAVVDHGGSDLERAFAKMNINAQSSSMPFQCLSCGLQIMPRHGTSNIL